MPTEGRRYEGKGIWTKVIMPDRDQKRKEVIEKAEKAGKDAQSSIDSKKEQNTIERYFLSGEGKVVPTTDIKARTTIRLSGLGKFISGLFYIEEVVSNWSNSGFSQSIKVSRNAVGDNIKSGDVVLKSPTPKEDNTRETPRTKVNSTIE